jgi:hypothetical protein
MLEVELDILSGMPNPKWTLTRQEEGELTERIQAAPEQVSRVIEGEDNFGLGYRGFIIRLVKQDDGPWCRHQSSAEPLLPSEFRVGSVPVAMELSVANWLLERSARRVGVKEELLSAASGGVTLVTPAREDGYPYLGDSRLDERDESAEGTLGTWLEPCASADSFYLDNGPWFSEPQNVGRNNCYCFASNHMSNSRFARPGRFGGRPDGPITVDEITQGLHADGWRDGCAHPGGLTIAAAIWPNVDFHFWRLLTNGDDWLWGHKKGGTAVGYRDDSGWQLKKFVTGEGSYIWIHPESCDRGDYMIFVGFFYQTNHTAFCR